LDEFLAILVQWLETAPRDALGKFDPQSALDEDGFNMVFLSGIMVCIMLKVEELRRKRAKTADAILVELLQLALDPGVWLEAQEMPLPNFFFVTTLIPLKIIQGESAANASLLSLIYTLACNFASADGVAQLDGPIAQFCIDYPQHRNVLKNLMRMTVQEIRKAKYVQGSGVPLRTDLT